jgi:hypothetical protein
MPTVPKLIREDTGDLIKCITRAGASRFGAVFLGAICILSELSRLRNDVQQLRGANDRLTAEMQRLIDAAADEVERQRRKHRGA